MRRDVQEIFKMTPHEKQVMMFSATLSKEIRPVCKKFMQDVIMQAVLLFGFMIQLIWYLSECTKALASLHSSFLVGRLCLSDLECPLV